MAEKDETVVADEGAGVKKKGSPILMYAIIAVVMIAAGYFGGQFMAGGSSSSSDETETAANKEGGHSTEQGGESSGKEGHANTSSEVYLMENIIVNPSGTGGTRFLSISIGFEIGSDNTKALFETKEAIIKDALITILGSKSIQQLSDAREKEITRYQIRKRVAHLLKVEDLSAVYFTDFVLQ